MLLSGITKKLSDVFSEVFSNKETTKKRNAMKYRKLALDPLEERQMLSVTTVMPYEQMATGYMGKPVATNLIEREAYDFGDPSKSYYDTYWAQESLAGNNQGDFVMTWSQNDYIVNPVRTRFDTDPDFKTAYLSTHGGVEPTPYLVDPKTGEYYNDWNVYARYFTDEIQRVSLPTDTIAPGSTDREIGSFKLQYAPETVQKLQITTASAPQYSTSTGNLQGSFMIGFDTGSGMKWAPVMYNEVADASGLGGPVYNAANIQAALQGMGGSLSQVQVSASGANEFLITFKGELSGKANIPELQIKEVELTRAGAFLPGILVTTESQPLTITNFDAWGNETGIPLYPNDPQKTAAAIQAAFSSNSNRPFSANSILLTPGVEYYSQDNGSQDSAYAPDAVIYTGPTVNVRAVNGTTFDITFVDGSGKIDHPELKILSAKDKLGNELIPDPDDNAPISDGRVSSVKTLKENSAAFRVNAPEPEDPLTNYVEPLNQMNASVAMDADGDFIVVWQGEVRGEDNQISTDVYGRKFSPQAIVAESKITFYSDGYSDSYKNTDGTTKKDAYDNTRAVNAPIQGVRPVMVASSLDETGIFQVNTNQNGNQMQPSVGIDMDGNFVIAWSDFGQNHSYFSGIMGKWYDNDGKAIDGGEIHITDATNNYPKTQSSVTMNNEGFTVIAWYETEDLNSGGGEYYHHQSRLRVFAPGDFSAPIYETVIGGGTLGDFTINAQVAFDANSNFLVSYTLGDPINGSDNDRLDYSDAFAESYAIQTTVDPLTGDKTYSVTQTVAPKRITGLYPDLWRSERDSGAEHSWALPQFNVVGGFDADGDMVFAYQGYGPDFSQYYISSSALISTTTAISLGTVMARQINSNKNADLLDYFNPSNFYGGSGDVDTVIRDILASAQAAGASDDQLGRINAVLESVLGMLRGGGNDIMTTRINTATTTGSGTNASQSSDAIVSSTRDGENTRFYITVPRFSANPLESANIVLSANRSSVTDASGLSSTGNSNLARIDFAFYANGGGLNVGETQKLIANALNGWDILGSMLNKTTGDTKGDIQSQVALVSVVNDGYGSAFAGTDWEISHYASNDCYVFEVILQGNAHDCEFNIWQQGIGTDNTYKRLDMEGDSHGSIRLEFASDGDQGSEQGTPGIHVLPNGSYVVSWSSDLCSTTGTVLDRNLNYRYFKETQDQVGATVTDVVLPNGERVREGVELSSAIKQVVLTFDEELNTAANPAAKNWAHSVLNPENWTLMKDGLVVVGGIQSIEFGMNKSMERANTGPLSLGSNKWEAVVEFDLGGGNPLDDGVYELILNKTVWDKADNEIAKRGGDAGAHAAGEDFTRTFSIYVTDGPIDFDNDNPDDSGDGGGSPDVIDPKDCDRGSAPNYYGDVAHQILRDKDGNVISPYLGTRIYAEAKGTYGDVTNIDNDGVKFGKITLNDAARTTYNNVLYASATGQTYTTIKVQASLVGYMSLWVDYNNTYAFEASDRVTMRVSGTTTWSNTGFIEISPTLAGSDGFVSIDVLVPSAGTSESALQAYARFRFTDKTIDHSKLTPIGIVANGEVEDYVVTIVTPNVGVSGAVFDDVNADSGRVNSSPVPEEIVLQTVKGSVMAFEGTPNYVTFDEMGLSSEVSIGFGFGMGGKVYDRFKVTAQGALMFVDANTPTNALPGFYDENSGMTTSVPTIAPFLTTFSNCTAQYSRGPGYLLVRWTDTTTNASFGLYLKDSTDDKGAANDDGDYVTVFFDGIPTLPTSIYGGVITRATADSGINFGNPATGNFGQYGYGYWGGMTTDTDVEDYLNSSTFLYDVTLDRYSYTYRLDPAELTADTRNSSIGFNTDITKNVITPAMRVVPITITTSWYNFSYPSTGYNDYTVRYSGIRSFGFWLEMGGNRYDSYRVSDDGRIGLVNSRGGVEAYIEAGTTLMQSAPTVDVVDNFTQGATNTRGNKFVQIRWNNSFGIYIENTVSGDIVTFFYTEDAYTPLDGGPRGILDNVINAKILYADGTELNVVSKLIGKSTIQNQADFDAFFAATAVYDEETGEQISPPGMVSYRLSAITGYVENPEAGIERKTVYIKKLDSEGPSLLDRNGNPVVILETITTPGENGAYSFNFLYPGNYLVWCDTDDTNWVPTTPGIDGDGNFIPYTVPANYATYYGGNTGYDFGFVGSQNLGVVTVNDLKVVEGDKGTSYAEVDVTLTGSFGVPVDIEVELTDGTAKAGVDYQAVNPQSSNGKYNYNFMPQVTPLGEWEYKTVPIDVKNDKNQYDQCVSNNTVAYELFDGKQWKIYIYYQPTNSLICLSDSFQDRADDRSPDILETTKKVNGKDVPYIQVVWSSFNKSRNCTEIVYSEMELTGASEGTVDITDAQRQLAEGRKSLTSVDPATANTNNTSPKISNFIKEDGVTEDILVAWLGQDASGQTTIRYIKGKDQITTPTEGSNNSVRIDVARFDGDKPVYNSHKESGLKLDGNRIVWTQTNDKGLIDVYLYDTTTPLKGLKPLTSSGINEGAVIYGDYVAWTSKKTLTDENSSVLLYSISQQKVVQTFGGGAMEPSLGGNWLVWQAKQTNKTYDVFAYNVEIASADNVQVREVTQFNPTEHDMNPQVYGNRVVWWSYFSDGYKATPEWEVRYADLDTANFIPVTISKSPNYDWKPSISNTGMVVWRTEDPTTKKFMVMTATQDDPVVHGTIRVPIVGNTDPTGNKEFTARIVPESISKLPNTDIYLAKVNPDKPYATVTILEDDAPIILDTNGKNVGGMDFSDAPATYGTLLKDDGARHAIVGVYDAGKKGIRPNIALYNDLVASVSTITTADVEKDGKPNVNADGDNTASSNDETGVIITNSWMQGDTITISVFASLGNPNDTTPYYLNAWVDWNQDGKFDDLDNSSEHLVNAVSGSSTNYFPLKAGENLITFKVPDNAITGNTYARFRVSSEKNLKSTGWAPDGEVEDYLVAINAKPSSGDGVPVYIQGNILYVYGSSRVDTAGIDNITITREANVTKDSDVALVVQVIDSTGTKNYSFTKKEMLAVNRVNVDASLGDDIVKIVGLASDNETIMMSPNAATLACSAFTLNVKNAKDIIFDGRGGRDVVYLYDDALIGNDDLTMSPNEAVMFCGNIYSNTVTNVKSIVAYSRIGNDKVTFIGSSNADILYSYADTVRLSDDELDFTYANRAVGFKNVIVDTLKNSGATVLDKAVILENNSSNSLRLEAGPDTSTLVRFTETNPEISRLEMKNINFINVTASVLDSKASATAVISGTNGNDKLVASVTGNTFTDSTTGKKLTDAYIDLTGKRSDGKDYQIHVQNFSKYEVDAGTGNDTVEFSSTAAKQFVKVTGNNASVHEKEDMAIDSELFSLIAFEHITFNSNGVKATANVKGWDKTPAGTLKDLVLQKEADWTLT